MSSDSIKHESSDLDAEARKEFMEALITSSREKKRTPPAAPVRMTRRQRKLASRIMRIAEELRMSSDQPQPSIYIEGDTSNQLLIYMVAGEDERAKTKDYIGLK